MNETQPINSKKKNKNKDEKKKKKKNDKDSKKQKKNKKDLEKEENEKEEDSSNESDEEERGCCQRFGDCLSSMWIVKIYISFLKQHSNNNKKKTDNFLFFFKIIFNFLRQWLLQIKCEMLW